MINDATLVIGTTYDCVDGLTRTITHIRDGIVYYKLGSTTGGNCPIYVFGKLVVREIKPDDDALNRAREALISLLAISDRTEALDEAIQAVGAVVEDLEHKKRSAPKRINLLGKRASMILIDDPTGSWRNNESEGV